MTQIKSFQLDIDEELLLSGDPTNPLGAATKAYVDDGGGDGSPASKVSKTGDTMTGDLIINADLTVNNITLVNTMDMGTF